MMDWFSITLFSIHIGLLFCLGCFGLHRLSMVWRWFRYGRVIPKFDNQFEELPTVTVQVPLYNERFVAERIVAACAALDYPQDKLQVQIVDDSTDDTSDLIAASVARFQSQGINIQHVRRTHRHGFKAGALKDALEDATGEFIAIFDADFVPRPELLKDNIHYFTNAKVGLIQFRWEHLNAQNSRLTKAQSMMLDAHFALEQQVRYASDMLLNFNGTAGVWRKSAIIDAGNWSADTLTEDLDLSYRAQLKGWKLLYINHVGCPAEIPSNMNAFKSQQHRWAKGGVQVMLKMLGEVWRSQFSLKKKVEATFHLSNNLAYFFLLLDSVLFLIPSLYIRERYQIEYIFWLDLPLLLMATGGHLVYLFFGQVALNKSRKTALFYIPQLMLLGIQLSFNNAKAGIEALLGHTSEFVRTPKSGEEEKASKKPLLANTQKQGERPFYEVILPKSALFELAIACVYVVTLVWAIENQIWLMLPFLLLLIIGFSTAAITNFQYQLTLRSSR